MTAANPLLEKVRIAHAARQLQLPSLPEVVLAIRDAVQDDRKGVTHIARLLQMDPILSARVLKIANSPLYHTGAPLTDIKLAVVRLGLSVTRNLVTCLVMHNLFEVNSSAMRQRIRELWQHSSRVAAIAQALARTQRGLSPEKALMAGLLHDIGVLPILVYADQFAGTELVGSVLDDAIATLRAELGNAALASWQMDADIVEVPLLVEQYRRDHAGEADYADLVIVAHIHSYFGQRTSAPLPALHQTPAFGKLAISKLGPEASLELLHQANTEIAATVRMLQNA